MWVDPKKLDEPAVLAAAFTESGLDASGLIEASSRPEVKEELLANTSRAVERGAFGSPTFFVNDEMWFGKDRLDNVEQAIVAQLTGS
jgi:2-hydroxychromene-2-carboxylate isomerase